MRRRVIVHISLTKKNQKDLIVLLWIHICVVLCAFIVCCSVVFGACAAVAACCLFSALCIILFFPSHCVCLCAFNISFFIAVVQFSLLKFSKCIMGSGQQWQQHSVAIIHLFSFLHRLGAVYSCFTSFPHFFHSPFVNVPFSYIHIFFCFSTVGPMRTRAHKDELCTLERNKNTAIWTNKWTKSLCCFDCFFFSFCYECINISWFVRFCWDHVKLVNCETISEFANQCLNIYIYAFAELNDDKKKTLLQTVFQYSVRKTEKNGILHVTLTCTNGKRTRMATDEKKSFFFFCFNFTEKTAEKKKNDSFGIIHPVDGSVLSINTHTLRWRYTERERNMHSILKCIQSVVCHHGQPNIVWKNSKAQRYSRHAHTHTLSIVLGDRVFMDGITHRICIKISMCNLANKCVCYFSSCDCDDNMKIHTKNDKKKYCLLNKNGGDHEKKIIMNTSEKRLFYERNITLQISQHSNYPQIAVEYGFLIFTKLTRLVKFKQSRDRLLSPSLSLSRHLHCTLLLLLLIKHKWSIENEPAIFAIWWNLPKTR